ncbi:hypothetical protein [Cetobacterium sp.]|uniref:hypothetical protein n=1 Tax=Cetobacterium sp. TaxID=2071632 RepID=UPI003EE6080C
MKRCGICGELLDESRFSKRKYKLNGFGNYCKSCAKEYANDYKNNQIKKQEGSDRVVTLKHKW